MYSVMQSEAVSRSPARSQKTLGLPLLQLGHQGARATLVDSGARHQALAAGTLLLQLRWRSSGMS